MKKSKVLSTPTRLSDLRFDDFDLDDDMPPKARRLSVQRWRQFKREIAS